jgi:FeS assembly SUF system regulator
MTKQADYGIVLMTRLAQTEARWRNASELSDQTGLPQPIVSKILKILARSRLLRSQRGVKGGYSLARAAREISVAEVIEALEGPISITECIDDSPGECSQEPICQVRGNWQRINEAIRGALEEISLQEMTQAPTSALVSIGGRESARNLELS